MFLTGLNKRQGYIAELVRIVPQMPGLLRLQMMIPQNPLGDQQPLKEQ